MKRSKAAALVAAFSCLAGIAGAATPPAPALLTTALPATDPAPRWTLYKGVTTVKTAPVFASQALCLAAPLKVDSAGARLYGQGSFNCRSTTIVSVVVGPPDMSASVYVNAAKIMKRGVGSATDDIAAAVQMPLSTGNPFDGDFRTVAFPSHMAFDDPIVYPGQPGASHLHAFFGNTLTNANSTAASIAGTGNSTARGGTINRSAYWVPAMIDTQAGTPIAADSMIVYYKCGALNVPCADIKSMPAGLRMVAGDPKAVAPPGGHAARFGCIDPTTGWGSPWTAEIQVDCPVGRVLWAVVQFPQCWDGVNLDSPDHRSHMAYGIEGANQPKLGCPLTHPVALPEVTFNVLYTIKDAASLKRWRLASDAYDRTQPPGYSLHGDWWNGWKPDVAATWATKCVATSKNCQAHMLGDGRTMSEAKP